MRYRFHISIITIVLSVVVGTSAPSQTLFQRPDTTPNYVAYQYPDQCLAAVNRIVSRVDRKDTIWRDTAAYDSMRITLPVPEEAIGVGRLCLSQIDVDSLFVTDYKDIIPTLLLINRDDDVNRIVHKALDNADALKKDSIFLIAQNAYLGARPKRVKLFEQLLAREDNLYKTSVSAGGELRGYVRLAEAALDLGEMEYASNLVYKIINENAKQFTVDKINYDRIGVYVYKLLLEVINDEAMDSLAVSTQSYRRFLDNTWKKLTTTPFPRSKNNQNFIGTILPQIRGDFWYTNLMASNGEGTSIALSDNPSKISPQVRPVVGKVNAILFLPGGCHSQSPKVLYGRDNGSGRGCWSTISLIKRLKNRFPEMEITVVSKTFGSIGNSPPLPPKDEADSLADYFLKFHKIPAIHVIAETGFIRMPGYDKRRIDLDVDYEHDLEINGESLVRELLFTDEYGKIFHIGGDEPLLIKKIGAVMRRLSARTH